MQRNSIDFQAMQLNSHVIDFAEVMIKNSHLIPIRMNKKLIECLAEINQELSITANFQSVDYQPVIDKLSD